MSNNAPGEVRSFLLWLILAVLVAIGVGMAGSDGTTTDPCLEPSPPSHCAWGDNGIGDDR